MSSDPTTETESWTYAPSLSDAPSHTIYGPRAEVLAKVYRSKDRARLVAAAPELLAALKELLASQLAIMPPFEAGKDAQNAWSDRRAQARNDAAAIIAKAEGRS